MVHIRTLGISILALLYCGAGGGVGGILFDLAHGRTDDAQRLGPLVFTCVANLLLLPCLLLLWRQRRAEPAITTDSKELRMTRLFLHGLPVNRRIAFALFATAWFVGFLLPIVFGF
jgi:hypothetical protein